MRLLISFAALCLACPALAAEIEAASRVEAVTLYPDAAQATRVVDVDLPAGASRVLLRGLPATLDAATLQIAGAGEAALTLGAVDVRRAPAPKLDGEFETSLKGLRDERDAAQVKADALAAKAAMIQAYGQKGPARIDDKPLSAQEWSAAFDLVGSALARTGEELRLARAAVAEIEARIKAQEAARPPHGPRGAAQDVAVDVEAPSAGKYSLSLTYRLRGARWTPAYEARLTMGDKGKGAKLEVLRRAAISQRTGEDWSDVSLSLAAFPAASGASAPEPQPQKLEFFEPQPMGGLMRAVPAPAAAPPAPEMADAAPKRREAAKPQMAQLDFNGVQALFRAPGKVSLASDGTTKLVALSTQSPVAELSWKTAPALDPRAFLSAHFVNGEEAPLLPGPVTLYRDGAMIGQGALKLIASQEGADLGFGPDERVTVTRSPVKRKENEPSWYGQTKTETRDYKTVLRNLHDFPVALLAMDQTPYSETNAITVELLPQTTQGADKDPEGKRGLLEWRLTLAPNESKELRLAYRMKWPADREVIGAP
ncbi:conserved hypothetical protein [Rhodoblastus acidophilus]|uniref:Mucoidy inhibitor MuiA family protein n=1 Tax=Rhodoblastus acidophilus TaxID=1074 RepID=A0A212QKC6_RHOAC|nr:mucoidy inhibitor MuiA family protein [Rhodoblastus acidophilus]PPQ39926.1 hypothetical protein CKO16_03740 [Rhodoblastus acidophilus]RAI23300.1 hypothetical protein CH337_03455 [Rhodoblastus acidophilus]SNB59766.1 conserved hypothetical protein [Rhodoblastus acidophilus]